MSITIDDAVIRASGKSEAEVRREIALTLYAQDLSTSRSAAAFAQMDELEFLRLCKTRDIAPYYDRDDLREDVATLKELGY